MSRDRRTLLHLVALGRMTAAEAERMFMLWNEERETLCVIAGCIALALAGEVHAGATHSLVPGITAALRHAASLIHPWLGGKQ